MFLYCVCDRAGQLGERGSLRREGRGEGCGYSEVPRWWPPPMSIKGRSFCPRWRALICTDHLLGFYGAQ
jgi:hypothetical protein